MAAARLLALDLLRAPAPASTLLVYTPGIASSRVGAKSDAFQALGTRIPRAEDPRESRNREHEERKRETERETEKERD